MLTQVIHFNILSVEWDGRDSAFSCYPCCASPECSQYNNFLKDAMK
jgi:hypothetical protein